MNDDLKVQRNLNHIIFINHLNFKLLLKNNKIFKVN